MTPLGLFLLKKSINKSEVSRRSGLSISRMSELSTKDNCHLRVTELCAIAEAIDIDPRDLLEAICGLEKR